MDFLYYPMDHQKLHFDIYSYIYNYEQLRLSWDRGSVLMQDIAAFVVEKIDKIEEVHRQGEFDASFLSFHIIVRRRFRYFVLQFFFPCILCALVSCLPFWMDRYEIGERLALGITTLLTEVFLSQYINSSMPRVSYIKAADEYLLATFIFIFGALLESVVVYNYRPDVIARKEEEKKNYKKSNKKNTGYCDKKTVGSDNSAVQSPDEVTGIEMVFFDDEVNNKNNKDRDTSNGHTATINDDKQANTDITINDVKATTDETTTEVLTRDKSLVIDQFCRVFFPLIYLSFQGYYFGRYLPAFYRGYK